MERAALSAYCTYAPKGPNLARVGVRMTGFVPGRHGLVPGLGLVPGSGSYLAGTPKRFRTLEQAGSQAGQLLTRVCLASPCRWRFLQRTSPPREDSEEEEEEVLAASPVALAQWP